MPPRARARAPRSSPNAATPFSLTHSLSRTRARTAPIDCAAHLGPLAWLLGLLCISLAAYFEYKEKDEVPPKRAWTLGQAVAIWVALLALAAAVAVQHRFGSTAHLASAGSLRGENDEDDVGSIGRGRRASSSGSQRLLLGNNNS